MNNQLIFQRRDEKSYWLLLRGLLNLKKIFIRFVFQEIRKVPSKTFPASHEQLLVVLFMVKIFKILMGQIDVIVGGRGGRGGGGGGAGLKLKIF